MTKTDFLRLVLMGVLGYALMYLVLGSVVAQFDVTDWEYPTKILWVVLGSVASLTMVLVEIDRL